MVITIEKNQNIQSLQIMCVCVCVCVCVCKKYKRTMCYHQKNNSNVKTFEMPKNIKES